MKRKTGHESEGEHTGKKGHEFEREQGMGTREGLEGEKERNDIISNIFKLKTRINDRGK